MLKKARPSHSHIQTLAQNTHTQARHTCAQTSATLASTHATVILPASARAPRARACMSSLRASVRWSVCENWLASSPLVKFSRCNLSKAALKPSLSERACGYVYACMCICAYVSICARAWSLCAWLLCMHDPYKYKNVCMHDVHTYIQNAYVHFNTNQETSSNEWKNSTPTTIFVYLAFCPMLSQFLHWFQTTIAPVPSQFLLSFQTTHLLQKFLEIGYATGKLRCDLHLPQRRFFPVCKLRAQLPLWLRVCLCVCVCVCVCMCMYITTECACWCSVRANV
jgi:hypothetical protein